MSINFNCTTEPPEPCPDPPLAAGSPAISAEWCNAAGEQIVVVYQVPGPDNTVCPPLAAPSVVPVVLGYFDATGTWTDGAPPAGYGTCGERSDFEIVKWCACDVDDEVIAIVLVEYEYDEVTHELISTKVLNPDGTEFTGTYDHLCLCPVTIDPQVVEVAACLSDDTGLSYPVKVVQTIDVNPDATIAGIIDQKIYRILDLFEYPFPLPAGYSITFGECKQQCLPYIGVFTGDAIATEPYNTLAINKPECCVIEVTTDAGTVILPKGMTSYCPQQFACTLEILEVEIVSGPCTLDQIQVFTQHTGS